MNTAQRIPRTGLVLLAILCVPLLWSCSSSPPAPRDDAIDPAIRLFLDGDYDGAIAELNALLDTPVSDRTRIDIYYYLGRSYLEKGDVHRATDAFTTGVQLGDDGPCLEYLEKTLPAIAGTPRSVRRMLEVPRQQLAALVVRWLQAGPESAPDLDGEPLDVADRRGWMSQTADGSLHGEAPVTRAAFYVFASRLCSDVHCAQPVEGVLGRYPRDDSPMSGVDMMAALGQLIPWKFPDGG